MATDLTPAFLTRASGEPRAALAHWRSSLAAADALLLVEFGFQPWWQGAGGPQPLTAVYAQSAGRLHCAVTSAALQVTSEPMSAQLAGWVEEHGLFIVTPGEPLPLLPEHIAKPWGQEIWYTGVEARGVCRFGEPGGPSVPIPWLQAVLPEGTAGVDGAPLVLLKILDPVAREVEGDLYFELHEQKREVYVITHVDSEAWPNGRGAIRFGFDPGRVAAAGSDAGFRTQYLDAVRAYERARREIDALRDGGGEIPGELAADEVRLRRDMESFTAMRPLGVGDVVVVPLLTPHSLQHGVRAIEFQTPVYERKILSFAQKVLTQGHWDTGEAVDLMRLETPPAPVFERLQGADGACVERIVDFEDFDVLRVRLAPGAQYVPELGSGYGLVMAVEGDLALPGGLTLAPEQAALLPAGSDAVLVARNPASALVLLLARPR